MHLLDTSTFLWRPRFSTFWHASLLISSSEQEQQRLNIWDHGFSRKNQQVSLWIMILFHLFPYFSISSPHPQKNQNCSKMNKTSQPQNPGKAFHTFPSILPNKKQELPSKDSQFSRFGVTDPISLGMPTQVGRKHVVFLLGIFGDIEKSCGSEYQREPLIRNYLYVFKWVSM